MPVSSLGLRAAHYEAFDVDRKVECIRALLPLGLMHVQEIPETEVCTLAGGRYMRKKWRTCPAGAMGSNPGSVQLAGQRHPCGFHGSSARAAGRLPYTPSNSCGEPARSMNFYSSGCFMASLVETTRPPRRRSLGLLGCRVRRCPGPSRVEHFDCTLDGEPFRLRST